MYEYVCKNVETPSQNIYFGVSLGYVTRTTTYTTYVRSYKKKPIRTEYHALHTYVNTLIAQEIVSAKTTTTTTTKVPKQRAIANRNKQRVGTTLK